MRRGPTGRRLAANLHDFRHALYLDTRSMAAKLEAVGHPFHQSLVSRIERGERGVGADELVALAAVLHVSPTRLLLDGEGGETKLALTPELTVTSAQAWAWCDGVRPLRGDPDWFRRWSRPASEFEWRGGEGRG